MAPFIRRPYLLNKEFKDDSIYARCLINKKRMTATDIDFTTALMKAVALDRKRLIKELLEKNSRVVQDSQADPLMRMVVVNMKWSTVFDKLVLLGASISDINTNGDNALHLAFVNGAKNDIVDFLLLKYLAVEPITNVENKDGLNFVHIASSRPSSVHIEKLISCGIKNINCQVNLRKHTKYAGYTPLHFAVFYNRYEIARLLLQNGANIYVRDFTGSTPLHLALCSANKDMIDLLFTHDQRRENYTNDIGLSHFMAACVGSATYIIDEFLYEQPMALTRLISRVADMKDHPYGGFAPLHFATKFGNTEIVQMLLDYGAPTFVMTSEKCSPMAIARRNRHHDILQLLHKYSNRERQWSFILRRMTTDRKWPNF